VARRRREAGHDSAWVLDADRARRPSRVRARVDPHPHERRRRGERRRARQESRRSLITSSARRPIASMPGRKRSTRSHAPTCERLDDFKVDEMIISINSCYWAALPQKPAAWPAAFASAMGQKESFVLGCVIGCGLSFHSSVFPPGRPNSAYSLAKKSRSARTEGSNPLLDGNAA